MNLFSATDGVYADVCGEELSLKFDEEPVVVLFCLCLLLWSRDSWSLAKWFPPALIAVEEGFDEEVTVDEE